MMDSGHEHFQQLAVGHVLGGLGVDDAAEFRRHLVGCRVCRARVAELRGIASDLERAERDERTRALVQTDVADAAEGADAAPPQRREAAGSTGPRIGVRHVTVATIVVMLLAAAMGFWNLHLRTSTTMLTTLAEQHAQTLAVLAAGAPVEVESDHPVRGLAAIDGERVAVTLAGVDEPAEGERLVAWLQHDDGTEAAAQLQAGGGEASTVAVVLDDADARRIEITRERGEVGDEPGGDTLASIELQAAGE